MKMALVFIILFAITHTCVGQINDGKNLSMVFKWYNLDFKWTNADQKEEYLSSKNFIPENCYIRDLNIHNNSAYITIPRWKSGVPVTLARILNLANISSRSPELYPYPSWELQDVNNCSSFQSIHSISTDKQNRLWILDSGVIGELETKMTICAPKIVILDLESGSIHRMSSIPEKQRTSKSIFTNMVLDVEKLVLFIADSTYFGSGIVVYSYHTGTFQRFHCDQLNIEDETADILFVPSTMVPQFASISLNTDRSKLYFSTYDSTDLLYVNVSVFDNSDFDDISSNTMNLGAKGRNIKLISDSKGYMYFDLSSQQSIAQWREGSYTFQYSPRVVLHSKMFYHWISSLFMDETTGYLWVVSTRFRSYIINQTDTQKENLRIYRALIPRLERPKKPKTGGFSLEYVILILFVVIIGLIIVKIMRFY